MATSKSAAAAVLIYVQAALGALTGLVLLLVAGRRRRQFSTRFFHGHLLHHPGLYGVVLLVLAAGLVALGIGVYRRRRGAAITAYVVEAIIGLVGLLGFHPVRSVLGLILAVIVILLIATDAPARSPM